MRGKKWAFICEKTTKKKKRKKKKKKRRKKKKKKIWERSRRVSESMCIHVQ